MKKLIPILFLAITALSCQSKKETPVETTPAPDSTATAAAAAEAQRNAFFSNLKAPAEVAAQLQATGADFNAKLLSDPKNASSYTTDQVKAAANLGIYLSDLNYSVAYKKSATTKDLFAAASELSKSIGIEQGLLDFLMKRYSANISKNDSAKVLINELLDKSTAGLQGTDREKLAGIAMSAYQIENLHLALGLIETYPKDMLPTDARTQILVPVYSLVLGQQQNVETIYGFLKSVGDPSNPHYGYYSTAFEDLIGVYKKLNVQDKIANNKGVELMNDAVVVELHQKVNAIRNMILSKG
jgi:hypothetical protein